MAQQHQKMLLGLLVLVTLTLQGCGTQKTEITTDTQTTGQTTETTNTVDMDQTDTQSTTDSSVPLSTGNSQEASNIDPDTSVSSTVALNGTFHLTDTYQSPAGPEPLDATVTIENNVITAVEAKNVAHAAKSKMYQDMFIKGIAGQVVGKNIKDVQVTYVNGSSLTAKAFNKALHDLEN